MEESKAKRAGELLREIEELSVICEENNRSFYVNIWSDLFLNKDHDGHLADPFLNRKTLTLDQKYSSRFKAVAQEILKELKQELAAL